MTIGGEKSGFFFIDFSNSPEKTNFRLEKKIHILHNDNTAQMLILAHFSTYDDQRGAKNQNQDFLKYTTARYIHLLKHLEVSTTGLNYNSQTNNIFFFRQRQHCSDAHIGSF